MPQIQGENPFIDHQSAILLTAAEIYRARAAGLEPGTDMTNVSLVPTFDMEDPDAVRHAERTQAEIDVAARAVARLALVEDRIEKGGILGRVARVERVATHLMERRYIRDARPHIDRVRSLTTYEHEIITAETA